MAGSRLERIGTIFSRTTGLIRTNVVKYDDRPMWYDVYRVFPPTLSPQYDREPLLPSDMPQEVPPIFYKEDTPRSLYYNMYGRSGGGVPKSIDGSGHEDVAKGFIDKYSELEKQNPDAGSEEIAEWIQKDLPSYPLPKIVRKQEAIEKLELENRRRKRNVLTAESLLSMFQNADKDTSKDKS